MAGRASARGASEPVLYLDWHAHAPLWPVAEQAAINALKHANVSSVHLAGRRAKQLLEGARDQVAGSLGVAPAEIVFCSGGTEACVLALLGLARAQQPGPILASPLEHPAVEHALARLAREGFETQRLELDHAGRVTWDTEALRAARLVVCQWVNHETGHLQPLPELAAACDAQAVPLFSDAVQAWGKLPSVRPPSGLTAAAFAGSKIGAGSGAGALYLRRGADFEAPWPGGSQERGLRPGAPNLPGLAALAAATSELSQWQRPHVAVTQRSLRDLLSGLGATLNSPEEHCVNTVVNASFPSIRSDLLVAACDAEGLCVSAGAACASGAARESAVLRALYPDAPTRASSALRISFGPTTTPDVASTVEARLSAVLARLGFRPSGAS